MDTQIQHMGVVPQYVLDDCIEEYFNAPSYRSLGNMNKIDSNLHIDTFTKLVESIIGKKAKYRSGNYYRHNAPYLPHTDWQPHRRNNINVVIPLQVDCDASLVVFDQTWNYHSVTWCMQYPVLPFETNTGVLGYPYQYPIKNGTGKDIDYDFWKQYLKMYPHEGLFGMSGEACKFVPNSIMIFDNQRIHGTSYFEGTKLGLTLRFEV